MFAEIILSKPSKSIDRVFHYAIPSNLNVQVGHEVLISFGYREMTGYVVGLVEKTTIKGIKEIKGIEGEEPLFGEKQIELAKWIADYYCSFFVTALKMFLPPKGKIQNPNDKIQIKSKIQNPNIELTQEQKKALEEMGEGANLLYGVTGSGKTEVYMRVIAEELEKGKQAIVLVPEIALTPQIVKRFVSRFGDQIAVLHSDMTLKQRREQWWSIKKGAAKIILGARSAIFAPVNNLGVIVLDEEYENSYKQDKNPRYHARSVAIKLAQIQGAKVILGSATPSIETFYFAKTGKYKKLTLSKRIDSRPLPEVEVIDIKQDRSKGILSEKLKNQLKQVLEKKEQAILFINRRGFFTFAMCQSCGQAVQCPHCSIALTYHSYTKKLHCNRCGFSVQSNVICPKCKSSSIRFFGTGTQRIEKEVADIYPQARILRWDKDTVSKRGSHEVFFAAFAEGKADVLIGTQMVAKGMDVANVTLVGVISADTALYFPDFRAAEHTFQLLTQVAGRAGRHHLPGKVIIQTLNPDHYAIAAAQNHDYEAFYQEEIKHREELSYPPFSQLITIMLAGPSVEKTEKVAKDLTVFLNKRIKVGVLGPALAAIPKLRGRWRYHILLKGNDLDQMRQSLLESLNKTVVPKEIRVTIDVEPMEMV